MYKGERFNGYTHLAGAIASVAGLAVLLYISTRQGDIWRTISFSIYGTTLLLLYVFSTLYHSISGNLKRIFQKFDHVAIYLLIAGTYTPFTLVTLRGEIGWTLFAVVWGLAIIGIIIDLLPRKGYRIVPVTIYLLMGWLVVTVAEPLTAVMPSAGFMWLIAGGLFYTTGLLFYILDQQHRFAHGIWHLFVLAGSISHFITVSVYV